MHTLKILALSGSLRKHSSNKSLLNAASHLAAEGVEIIFYEGLGELPHFNPDLEGMEPASVINFRAAIQDVDAVLISSPEYAHGISGTLKNALDWLVGSGELVGKPVAALNASPRATHAQASLLEILTTMDAHLVTEACISLPILGSKLDEIEIVSHAEIAPTLKAALDLFVRSVENDSHTATN